MGYVWIWLKYEYFEWIKIFKRNKNIEGKLGNLNIGVRYFGLSFF